MDVTQESVSPDEIEKNFTQMPAKL